MQIVIDIPKEVYEYFTQGFRFTDDVEMAIIAIVDGTPLPKGHGRLIDADALEGHRQIQIVPCGNGKYTEVTTYYQNDIDAAPTIVEADTESEDKG